MSGRVALSQSVHEVLWKMQMVAQSDSWVSPRGEDLGIWPLNPSKPGTTGAIPFPKQVIQVRVSAPKAEGPAAFPQKFPQAIAGGNHAAAFLIRKGRR